MAKFTLKKAFSMTSTGREKVCWYVMDGSFVTDAFDLKRDAVYYMGLWNSEAARNGIN